MLKNIIAVAVMAVASNASALPLIDFTGIAAGAQVLDYYNGGTDSTGASGVNYGIRFDGGTIVYDEFGPRLENAGIMTFAADIVPVNEWGYYNVSFLANTRGEYEILNHGTFVFRPGSSYCSNLTDQQCFAIGHDPYRPSSMDSYRFNFDGTETSVNFKQISVDNIEFGAPFEYKFRRAPNPFAEVPEPGILALLGLGLAGLIASRRRA